MSEMSKTFTVTICLSLVLRPDMLLDAAVREVTFRSYDNFRVSGTADYVIKNTRVRDCCVQCMNDDNCNSVSYDTATGDCEVNNNRKLDFSGTTLEARSGWRLYEREPCGLGFQSGAHCHHVISTYRAWSDALDGCVDIGESLPEVRNEKEKDDLVADVMATGKADLGFIWIGLNDETMLWASGNPANYTYWSPGEPSSSLEQCTLFYLNWADNNEWLDYPCHTFASSVCERRFDL